MVMKMVCSDAHDDEDHDDEFLEFCLMVLSRAIVVLGDDTGFGNAVDDEVEF